MTDSSPTEPPTRFALFGGTFNPPHVGHVLAAHYVLLTSGVKSVLVAPCAQHPFGKGLVEFHHRLAMCRLAFQWLGEGVEVLDLEGRRDGPSYTIDTVRALQEDRPGARFELVIGSDNLADLDDWKESQALLRMVDLRVLPRLDETGASGDDSPFCLPRVSSSTVRERLAQGEDVSDHLPCGVERYIRQHGLYV